MVDGTDRKDELAELAAVPLLQGLSKKQLSRLYREATIVKHGPEHVVVTEGHAGHGFHFIRSGVARVVRNGRTIDELGPGEFFGEFALIDSGPRTATVITNTPVEALVISRPAFKRLVQDHPALAWRLLEHITGRLREERNALGRGR